MTVTIEPNRYTILASRESVNVQLLESFWEKPLLLKDNHAETVLEFRINTLVEEVRYALHVISSPGYN